ncbi:MAG: inositol-3-phosphate synthase [Alphaproteobacteria bacterium]|nr:inositol-3-phosphate synthase [Alphaproteobacteria bacterium]
MNKPTTPPSKQSAGIAPPKGRLGVLIPGMGAVATTLIAGVNLIAKGHGRPIGSLTQMQKIQIGNGGTPRYVAIKDLVHLAEPGDLVFGGWDITPENAYQTACNAGVLGHDMLSNVRRELEAIAPWRGVFDQAYVRNLKGTHVKTGASKMDLAKALMDDIKKFLADNDLERAVMLWCGSTEVYSEPGPVHQTLESFEQGLRDSAPEIAPSMIYAYASLMCGIPYANGAPNLSVEIPALIDLANRKGIAVGGRDFKTGQTMMKTVVAPGLQARMLGLEGWYSTNIIGNKDGEVLDDSGSFKAKEVSKGRVLDSILQPDLYPELYGDYHHKVRIDYYPPRGDAKEGWDNIDIQGWLGQSMQIKVNFLCRDSILAAPIALDLILFMDLAQRAGLSGIQEWLSFYYKAPTMPDSQEPQHDLFVQHLMLTNMLRALAEEEALDQSDLGENVEKLIVR